MEKPNLTLAFAPTPYNLLPLPTPTRPQWEVFFIKEAPRDLMEQPQTFSYSIKKVVANECIKEDPRMKGIV